jgi:tryptophan halogenase
MSKTVVIVGGGSSGWMTAAYLIRALKGQRVVVVESSSIRTIGVGEATFSYMKLFFDFLGLREVDWMPHCSAAYKLAIRFVNWTKEPGHFYHPFQRYEVANAFNLGEWWLKLLRGELPFDYACFTIPALCDAKKSPRHLDGTVFDEKVHDYYADGRSPPNVAISGHTVQYPYGYHFNAAELAEFLQRYAVKRGVSRIVDEVVEVLRTEDGAIAGLRTQEHGVVEGDLFVDCTGFRGLLINQAMGEPFISFNDTLLNDSAVALQVPRDIEREGMRPYTTAHTHSAGWSWDIPLYGRDGTGYVYSSRFIDKEEAEREFREFLGPAADGCVAHPVRMRIGRCRRSWVKNCVAIGLSSGFVEPLESTGLFFIQHAIEELVNHFPGSSTIDEQLSKNYNRVIADCVEGVREFLTLHYYASGRVDTPYWRAVKQVELPAPLAERFELWKGRLPTPRTIYPFFHGFEAYSWSVMALGLDYLPDAPLPILDHHDESQARAAFAAIQKRTAALLQSLPTQVEYLTHMRRSL